MAKTMTMLCIDLETYPNLDLIKAANGYSETGLDIYTKYISELEKKDKSTFPNPIYHSIISFGYLLINDKFDSTLGVFNNKGLAGEKTALSKFFKLIDAFQPTLVTWNGNYFDMLVIQHRSLTHGVASSVYWDKLGDAKWNNYLSKYHSKHFDMKEILSNYTPGISTSLNVEALSLGLAGKLVTTGDGVYDLYNKGELSVIQDYNEIDVLNTALIYAAHVTINSLTKSKGLAYISSIFKMLSTSNKPHHIEFLEKSSAFFETYLAKIDEP